ncbi:MAG: BREX-1 system adenine-specific DNA-methyltransferase PglX [Candidatus Flexifilum sp.]
MTLTDAQRKAIHDLALNARALLMQDTREHLESVYGLTADGQIEPPARLPRVREDPEAAETYRRLCQFLDDEARAGIPRPEAVDRLVREAAFTHLNRLVAFKMLETRRLIRGTLDRGLNSNGFKIYLVEVEGVNFGDEDAYRRFLLWQAGQIAQEIAVLFDPDTLASRIFPRPRALNELLALLNHPDMEPCWRADETIGWVYQFFNEQEKQEVFEGLKNKRKIRRQDIPAATQLFTPNWIVRFLVQNTLGRTWVQMHPDTRLLGTDLLTYLVPLQGDVPAEPLRPVREIALLDPACGTMHFGLVAFDLFAAMYQEELERAGEPGWPATPSVSDPAAIAEAIIAHNLYGIDIDLRAVQLSALALYLKAKALNKNARITDSHLACADVLPLNGARLGAFLGEMRFSPLIEGLIRALWERLKDANQFGALLRLEREIETLLHARGEKPMLARMEAGFGVDLSDEDFWAVVYNQIVSGLNEFARRQAETGADMRFFTAEAVKGLRLLDVLLRRYDVVVTNPPYSGKRNLNDALGAFLDDQYPDTKGDLYAAFIERCTELLETGGRLGMITQQSFMFLSSYEQMRRNLRVICAVEAMAHTGPRAFAEIGGEKVNTTVFTLHAIADAAQRATSVGTYIRLVNAPPGDAKREALERALKTGANVYHAAPHHFDAIPGAPWAYWVSEKIRALFRALPKLGDVAEPRQGLATADNFRFLRLWWEVGTGRIGFGCASRAAAAASGRRWFPYMKGGAYRKWYGNQEYVVNWHDDGGVSKFKQIQSLGYGPDSADAGAYAIGVHSTQR